MKKTIAFAAVFAGTLISQTSFSAEQPIAVLQGLDKVTARVSTFEAPLNQKVKFGALSITMRHCDLRPPEEPPESASFLEIYETKRGEISQSVFTGWMFASSPALSGMEHPVYDIWVLECKSE